MPATPARHKLVRLHAPLPVRQKLVVIATPICRLATNMTSLGQGSGPGSISTRLPSRPRTMA